MSHNVVDSHWDIADILTVGKAKKNRLAPYTDISALAHCVKGVGAERVCTHLRAYKSGTY